MEELGVKADVGEVLADSHYRYEHGEILLVALKATLESKALRLNVHDRVDWLTPDELLGLDLAPGDIPIARYLLEQSYDD
jgi:8-oxo-dGTP diphosphatase